MSGGDQGGWEGCWGPGGWCGPSSCTLAGWAAGLIRECEDRLEAHLGWLQRQLPLQSSPRPMCYLDQHIGLGHLGEFMCLGTFSSLGGSPNFQPLWECFPPASVQFSWSQGIPR